MKYLWVLLLLIGSVHAEPLRYEAQVGVCQVLPKEEGSWWLGEKMLIEPMRSGCYQLGVSQKLGNYGWRASWSDLGHFDLKETAYGGPGPQPHWNSEGSGSIRGLSLGVLTERPISKAWDWTAETGLFAYRSKWQAMAFHNAPPAGRDRFVDPPSYHGVAPYVGVGLIYGNVTLSTRAYLGIHSNTFDKGDHIGPARSNVYQFTLGMRIW